MDSLKHNLLVQFSAASLIIIAAIAVSTYLILSKGLDHQAEHLRDHEMRMASNSAPDEHPATIEHMANNVGQLRRQAYLSLGSGFLVLYLGLTLIVWGGWKTITRQQKTLANQQRVLVQANADILASNQELRAFSTQLEQSNRELESFASVAAHDLQEPLRKVQAFGDRLRDKCSDSLNEEGLDYLQRMQNAAGRMQTLISDLLTFSRVTTRAQPFVPVDLESLAREVLSDMEVRIEELDAKVELEELPTIDADPMQMRQLLQNLIGNALKFRDSTRKPVVRIRGQVLSGATDGSAFGLITDSSNMFQMTVEDNGIGFQERYADRIFSIFQRLHGRGEYEGTGIGLAVCRKIAERHGGHIAARSIPNKGSTFTVSLPVEQTRDEVTVA